MRSISGYSNTHPTLRELGLRPLFLPAKQRGDADEPAEEPDEGDHEHSPARRPALEVADRLRDGPVPVQTDEANVVDGTGADQDVDGAV